MDSMLQKMPTSTKTKSIPHQRHAGHAGAVIIGCLGVSIGGIIISLYMPLFAMIGKLAG